MKLTSTAIAQASLLRDLWNLALHLTCSMQLAEELVAKTYQTATTSDMRMAADRPPHVNMFSISVSIWLEQRGGKGRDLNAFLPRQRTDEETYVFQCSMSSLTEHERIAV